jgi:hypothetical protein
VSAHDPRSATHLPRVNSRRDKPDRRLGKVWRRPMTTLLVLVILALIWIGLGAPSQPRAGG